MRDNTEISALTALKSLLERHLCSVDGTKAAPAFKSRLFSTKIPLLFPFLADEIMKYRLNGGLEGPKICHILKELLLLLL